MTRKGTVVIKNDNTAASLRIPSVLTMNIITRNKSKVTDRSRTWEANSFSATHSIPCLLQNTWVHYHFHHSLTHTLSPNFLSPPVFCSHTYSSLNNITIMAHMFSELQTSCWHNKMRVKKRETLTNQGNHNLAYWPYIGTNNIWQNSKTTNITVILNWNERKNSVNDKHNPQAKLPVLNWHHWNTNITTVKMLIVLLQWLCSEV